MKNIKTAVIIVTLIIAAGILLGGNKKPDPTPSPTTPAHAAASAASATESQPGTAAPPREGYGGEPDEPAVATPQYEGGEQLDWTVPAADRQFTIDTATRFVAAWLQPDPQVRAQALAPVAAQALIDDLAHPQLKTWAATAVSPPTIIELASTNAMLRQEFSDGRTVDILLIADPGTATGWLVTDIAPTPPQP